MDGIEELATIPAKVRPQEVQLAKQVIGTFEKKLDLSDYHDEYREGLQKIIDAKIAGEEVVAPAAEMPPKVVNLMEALRKSLDSVSATNPMVVEGRARTFENTVQVRARDSRGVIVVENCETSVGEMGHHNPYVAQLWLVRDPGPYVTVEAFEYSAKDGSVRSLTSRRVDIPPARIPLTVMFSTTDCTRTMPFTRRVPRTVATARLLVEMLVAGPDSAESVGGATGPFPRGARVRSAVLRDGELTVDFNERLQNVGGSCAAQAIRASVEQTLSRLPAVKRVVITAAGSRELALQP